MQAKIIYNAALVDNHIVFWKDCDLKKYCDIYGFEKYSIVATFLPVETQAREAMLTNMSIFELNLTLFKKNIKLLKIIVCILFSSILIGNCATKTIRANENNKDRRGEYLENKPDTTIKIKFDKKDSILVIDTLFRRKQIKVYWSTGKYISAYYNNKRTWIGFYVYDKNYKPQPNSIKDILIYKDKFKSFYSSIPLDSNRLLFTLEDNFKFNAYLFGLQIVNGDIAFFSYKSPYKMPIANNSSKIMVDIKNKAILTNGGIVYSPDSDYTPVDTVGKWLLRSYSIDKNGFMETKTKLLMTNKLKHLTVKDVNSDPNKTTLFYSEIYKKW